MTRENRIWNILDTRDGLAGGYQFDNVSKRRGIRGFRRLGGLLTSMFLAVAVTAVLLILWLCRSIIIKAITLAIGSRVR